MLLQFDNANELLEFIEILGISRLMQSVENEPVPEFAPAEKVDELSVKINNLNKNMGLLETALGKMKKDLAMYLSKPYVTDKDIEVKDEPKTIREYSDYTKKRVPEIRKITKNGKVILKNNKRNNGYAKWTIYDLLKIKSRINNITDYPSFTKIAEDMEVSAFTVNYLCYGIETGAFDNWFNKWEQMQANKFNNHIKKAPVINNPQKRNENQMGSAIYG